MRKFDPKRALPISPDTGGEHRKAGVGATRGMGETLLQMPYLSLQGTKIQEIASCDTMATENILTYRKGRQSQAKRAYLKWRSQQIPPIPERCDEPSCTFYHPPLIWNGKKLKPILDHKNGVSGDNRPENLQLLCPNCNSQQPTHAGGNKGKVIQDKGGFTEISKGWQKGLYDACRARKLLNDKFPGNDDNWK